MIYLDIETLDFFQDPHIKALPRAQQLAAMRFGLAVTYDDYRNFTQTWLPHQIIDLYHHYPTASTAKS